MWVQRVVLEDHGDVAVLGRQVRDVTPIDADRAFVDVLQAGEHPQRCGLSATRGADEDEELAVGYFEIEAIDCGGLRARIDAGCVVELDTCQSVTEALDRLESAGRSPAAGRVL